MNTFLRNTISKLYNAVSASVAATRDALAERLQSVRETASLLYNRLMENMGYGRETDIVEKEEEEEVKEQQQDDDVQYDTVAKIKLVYEGRRVKEFRVTGNLNKSNTKTIMANTAPHIEMRTRVTYSFKSEIHWGAGEIVPYNKTLTSPSGMFTSLRRLKDILKNVSKNGWIWIMKKYGQKLIYPPKEQPRQEVIMKTK